MQDECAALHRPEIPSTWAAIVDDVLGVAVGDDDDDDNDDDDDDDDDDD